MFSRRVRYRSYLLKQRLLGGPIFIHINKCGGTSVEKALGIPVKIHDTALERRAKVGRRRWEASPTFALVRHPYSKVISLYSYRIRTDQTRLGRDTLALNDWIRACYVERDPAYYDKPVMFAAGADWLCDEGGRVLVDFVGKLETIAADWKTIQRLTGSRAELETVNASPSSLRWGDLSRASLDTLNDAFRADFELFGYDRA